MESKRQEVSVEVSNIVVGETDPETMKKAVQEVMDGKARIVADVIVGMIGKFPPSIIRDSISSYLRTMVIMGKEVGKQEMESERKEIEEENRRLRSIIEQMK